MTFTEILWITGLLVLAIILINAGHLLTTLGGLLIVGNAIYALYQLLKR